MFKRIQFNILIRYLVIVTLVISSYTIFLLPHLSSPTLSKTPNTQYLYLSEGFLSGHLYLSIPPSPELLKLSNPYDPLVNEKFALHDASLFQGHYYLYFGPLPVFTFFIPFKLITGYYPSEPLGVLFFIAIGFMLNFYLLIKIKNDFFPKISAWQLYFFGLLLGLANNSCFLLTTPRFYEVAIASAYCFTSLALIFLYNLLNRDFRTKDIFLFATFMSLAVAGRASFSLICAVLIVAVTFCLYKFAPRTKFKTSLIALWLPAMCIGLALGIYNYLRFHSFFEFGIQYQLGMQQFALIYFSQAMANLSHFYYNIPLQLYYYLIQPVFVHNNHPLPMWMKPLISGTIYEYTVGILSTAPCVIFIILLPKLFKKSAKPNAPSGNFLLCFLIIASLIPITAFITLAVICATAARYEFDFLPYLLFISIVCFWLVELEVNLSRSLRNIAKLFFIFTGIISICIGIIYGLTPYGGNVNYIIFSKLTISLFFLLPVTIGITYAIIRSLYRVDAKCCPSELID